MSLAPSPSSSLSLHPLQMLFPDQPGLFQCRNNQSHGAPWPRVEYQPLKGFLIEFQHNERSLSFQSIPSLEVPFYGIPPMGYFVRDGMGGKGVRYCMVKGCYNCSQYLVSSILQYLHARQVYA